MHMIKRSLFIEYVSFIMFPYDFVDRIVERQGCSGASDLVKILHEQRVFSHLLVWFMFLLYLHWTSFVFDLF